MPPGLVGQGWRGADTQTLASSPLAISAPFQDTACRSWQGVVVRCQSAFGNRHDFLLPLSESDFH